MYGYAIKLSKCKALNMKIFNFFGRCHALNSNSPIRIPSKFYIIYFLRTFIPVHILDSQDLIHKSIETFDLL